MATPTGSSSPADASSRRCRILVVDDSVDAAWALATLLELSGHQAEMAHDGPSALTKAEESRPDAVLLDLGLPGMSGIEVCQQIRRQPWGQQVIMIAVTGWGRETDRQKSRDAGFDHHVVKPVDPDQLIKVLAAPSPRG